VSHDDVRACFAAATQGFLTAVAQVPDDSWDAPGLGEWTVRQLVGHTARAFSTIESYLATTPAEITVHDPRQYLQALRTTLVDHAAVAARGREAGAALGDDPGATVTDLAERVGALVAATPDDAPLAMALGGTTLLAYLPTRTFELTVHTLDLVAALDIEVPAVLAAPVAASATLLVSAAATGPDGVTLLMALTGRRSLPAGFSLV
jgi:uncharacterized protein (TIGR03083 family)